MSASAYHNAISDNVYYMELVQQGDKTVEARKEILLEQRNLLASRMEEMQKTMDRLN